MKHEIPNKIDVFILKFEKELTISSISNVDSLDFSNKQQQKGDIDLEQTNLII